MPKNMRKTVSFGDNSETTVKHTKEELEALWYTKSELQNIRNEEVGLAKDTSEKEVNDEEVCLRGLEPFQEGYDHFKMRRHNFVVNLLAVQSEMKELHVHDPKGLQAFAAAHSQQDCRDARRRGKRDATEVGANPGKLLSGISIRKIRQPLQDSDGALAA